MRHIKSFSIIIAATLALMLMGCGPKDENPVVVNNFDVQEVLKSASRTYTVALDGEEFYLNVNTAIHWPVKFGKADLQPLRDSLLVRMYDVAPGTSVDDAISDFIKKEDIFGAKAKMEITDSISLDTENMIYEIDYNGKLLELTERFVSYQITTYSFLGGAHPNYTVYPFTYDLQNGRMLTFDNMFKDGNEAKLLKILKEYLAMQLGVSVSQLGDEDISVEDMKVSRMIYLSGGGVIFHYNPYEIAPYSRGSIDIEVPAFELSPYLTPEADALING